MCNIVHFIIGIYLRHHWLFQAFLNYVDIIFHYFSMDIVLARCNDTKLTSDSLYFTSSLKLRMPDYLAKLRYFPSVVPGDVIIHERNFVNKLVAIRVPSVDRYFWEFRWIILILNIFIFDCQKSRNLGYSQMWNFNLKSLKVKNGPITWPFLGLKRPF